MDAAGFDVPFFALVDSVASSCDWEDDRFHFGEDFPLFGVAECECFGAIKDDLI